MKHFLLSVITLALNFSAQAATPPTARVSIQPEIQGNYQAGTFEYKFQLLDHESNQSVRDQDLNLSHTKKIHLIAYDESLQEFNHVHPTFDGLTWNVVLNLPVDGSYFVWAQGELLDGTAFSTFVNGNLINGAPKNSTLPLGDVRNASDKETVFEMAKSKIRAGKMVMLNFKVSRTDGVTPIMAPYLGAFAHVIATPASGNELIHVHPMQGNEPNSGMIHATFPKEGTYRLWVQFIEHDELKTIPLSVVVFK